MGFLSNYYNKPGPGVAKGAPKPNRFVLFWQIFGRHFSDLVKVNLIFMIPTAVLGVLCGLLWSRGNLNLMLALLPLILLSPFMGGLTYATRNYAREEHVFIWHDFMKHTKENWKKFLINGVIVYIVVILAVTAIQFYSKNQNVLGPVLSVLALAICLGLLFIFVCMQFYVPMQIVTFDMSLKQIYKNGVIFAILGLWRNLLLVVILGIELGCMGLMLYLGAYLPLLFFLVLIITIFFLFSFVAYLVNFTVYPILDKHMIQPALKRQWEEKKARGELTPEEEADFIDWDSVHDDDDDDDDDD